jgi:hypothetical protein
MKEILRNQFLRLSEDFVGYLPNLLGGILILIIGWIIAWLVKRFIIRLSSILKLERFILFSRWKNDLSKGDVRQGVYRFIGNASFVIIFLIFLDNAFIVWKMTMLTELLSRGIYYLPKIIIALFIFGMGWLISFWTAKSVMRSLVHEQIPRASFISRFVKAILLLFFSAMALVVLDIAKEIVIIGFATMIGTLGAIAVVMVAVGGKKIINLFRKTVEDEDKLTDEE